VVKFTHKGTDNHAKLSLNVQTYPESSMELVVGAARGFSQQEIALLEKNTSELTSEVARLQEQIVQLERSLPASPKRDALSTEGRKITKSATRIMSERKWYNISASGLLEAAKAVGKAAMPLVGSAQKVIALLKELQA
jgi:hypothetical protein